jgi:hypothetical protein
MIFYGLIIDAIAGDSLLDNIKNLHTQLLTQS